LRYGHARWVYLTIPPALATLLPTAGTTPLATFPLTATLLASTPAATLTGASTLLAPEPPCPPLEPPFSPPPPPCSPPPQVPHGVAGIDD
jgi:hypothetical protein